MGWFFNKDKGKDKEHASAPAGTSSTSSPDFNVLASQARNNPNSRAEMDALWGAVYSLPSWIFIDAGTFPDSHPATAVIDGTRYVMGFTDHPAADYYWQGAGVTADRMILDIVTAAQMIFELEARGATHVLFNYGPNQFFCPIQNIAHMYDYFNKEKFPLPY